MASSSWRPSSLRERLTVAPARSAVTMKLKVANGFGSIDLPNRCRGPAISNSSSMNKCPPDPYIVHDKSLTFVDQQVMKLQEAPDMVPVERDAAPHHTSSRSVLTSQVVPGSKSNSSWGYYLICKASNANANEWWQCWRRGHPQPISPKNFGDPNRS